ncbi:MAG: hypothetical protein ABI977_03950, partial [Acidobacteriota bacterium]
MVAPETTTLAFPMGIMGEPKLVRQLVPTADVGALLLNQCDDKASLGKQKGQERQKRQNFCFFCNFCSS